MDIEADLNGILNLLRHHIEIRNRSWMKRVHRDCFIGSEAVDFLVTQGLADSRNIAVKIGQRMLEKKMIINVMDSRKKFKDAYWYYRFADDNHDMAVLSPSYAGNGTGVHPGQGGCKFSFAPHTAHNSYILDVALAEEIERAVAGVSVEARARAIGKLRARVKEEAEQDAPDWVLSQSSEVNNTLVSVFERKRPRGDFKNVKINGMIGETPKGFITSILAFDKRRQWESMMEDGVIVDSIDIGEVSTIFDEEDIKDDIFVSEQPLSALLPEKFLATGPSVATVARTTDDLLTFLQTVDLAGIPRNMCIGFLNDPERQHALAHLRKQMMLSNPQECMLCGADFDSPADIRFCPCCAMVSCGSCVSKRVFELVSRQVVSVCVHCFRTSSRVRHPPEAVQDGTAIDADLRGKWWRPEELGLVDYSQTLTSETASTTTATECSQAVLDFGVDPNAIDAPAVDPDAVEVDGNANPLLHGILDQDDDRAPEDESPIVDEDDTGDGINQGVDEAEFLPKPPAASAPASAGQASSPAAVKTARCKICGEMIPRDMDAIEKHMEECQEVRSGRVSSVYNGPRDSTVGGAIDYYPPNSNARVLGGITRRPELSKSATRIIYRTSRAQNKSMRPREVCALQDTFMDPTNGTCYAYEISVRHSDVRGIPGYVTADVLCLIHVARPIRGSKSTCNISIISQVDTRAKESQWLAGFLSGDSSKAVGVMNKEDLVRELKACGDLQNILRREQQEEEEDAKVCLDDFELLAVLGRGGFGKVMQVKHKQTGEVYAMKILKKTELRRRRQVERTQTERSILAAVKHPFIVCLHYAFQNSQKLYMVMDFVQGGDFFTLMRKFHRLPEDWVRVYICEIALALQHLHDMDIVYRDLKPENILLCGDGHVKLTDFGLSRFFAMRPPAAEDMVAGDDDAKTLSFCGTEQYMSPEMLLQQGHNFRMDWWCLGLLMHEMISARHPFHGPSHYDTLRNMVTKQPTIDARLSTNAATVVRSLLIKNPKARMCCTHGVKELYTLPYFAGVNWEALLERKIPMPYKPELTGNTDISSFETTFTKEAPVDSVAVNASNKRSKAGGKKGLMGYIFGSNQAGAEVEEPEVDSFKGFSFAKEGLDGLNIGAPIAPNSNTSGAANTASKPNGNGNGSMTTSTSPSTSTSATTNASAVTSPSRK